MLASPPEGGDWPPRLLQTQEMIVIEAIGVRIFFFVMAKVPMLHDIETC